MLTLAALTPARASAPSERPPFPALTGPVVDQAQLLPPSARARLAQRLAAYAKANGKQLVVVTLPTLNGYPIADYGYQLGRYWGIGQKGRDNGALLIVDVAEHRVRIEVGYGLEGRLTDAASSDIIRNIIVPYFRAGDYAAGITAGSSAILQVMGGTIPAARADASPRHHPLSGLLMLLAVYLFIALLRTPRGPGGSLWPALFLGFGLGGGFGGGAGGGGGRSDDDDFSGGGGSFGGGGASGGW